MPFFVADGAGETQRAAWLGRRDVAIEGIAPLGIDRAIGRQRRIVDQHMQGAETRGDLLEHRRDFSAGRHIATQRQTLGAIPGDRFAGLGQRLLIHIANHQFRTGFGEGLSTGSAKPRANPGNQHHFVFELQVHHTPLGWVKEQDWRQRRQSYA
ncbi:hypothetical protein D3C76_1471810 [compost metagenome]